MVSSLDGSLICVTMTAVYYCSVACLQARQQQLMIIMIVQAIIGIIVIIVPLGCQVYLYADSNIIV